ncbi:hypothetical protein N7462_011385 [Penicillium macrosclerotiorum]|uniref:uncharacterized protein n=1 Tax=Penicillium macrosclerotiorum TaxID=303699 RepID=UPI002546DB56|nr:uncharacterized protein N7462_011385 [Penicillium macrosclerotiorum]KAJ5666976.1 hypothetical protein N7462_011385 [Penicillium macrosclerotiorum]
MSFLDSVLSSLQTNKPSQGLVPHPPTAPAQSPAPTKDEARLPATLSAPRAPANTGARIKRKAEDELHHPSRPDSQMTNKPPSSRPPAISGPSKTLSKPVSSNSLKVASPRPVPKNGTASVSKIPPAKATPAKAAPSKAAPLKQDQAPSKPPPKGSFADIMMQAQAKQKQAPAQVGMLRHQAVSKKPMSKVERKRQLMAEKASEKVVRSGKRVPEPASTSKSAAKKRSTEVPSYKGTAKPSRTPEPPAYRGTAGLPSIRGENDRRAHGKRRRDEYLGTDEEDEGDYGYGGYDDYYSDASSDMEAGFDDMADEEDVALKSARREDEEEMRQEMAAKRAKMERQKKLAALASRKR